MVKDYHPCSKRGRIVKILKEAGEPLTAYVISRRITERWPRCHWSICSNGVSGLCRGMKCLERSQEGSKAVKWAWVGV